jgi:hypothetical protein
MLYHRLCSQVMAFPLVASRWLACLAVFCRLRDNCIPMETIPPQQKICAFVFFISEILIFASTLAMSDEIAQDEEDAEDYDLEALEARTRALDDDDATLVDRRGPDTVSDDNVVFEIGDEDAGSDTEESPTKKRRGERPSLDHNSAQDEREGLMRQATD